MNTRSELTPYSSRRRFLSQLAFAGAAVPLTQVASRSVAAEPKAKSPAPRPSTPPVIHVFSKPLHWLSYAETAAMAKEAGYGGIDYTVRVAQGHVLPDKVTEDLPRAVDAAHAAGLKVELITTDITSVRDPHAEKLLRTAAKVGVKCYRLGNFKYDDKLGVIGSLHQHRLAMKELAALNQSLGLHGAIQNHAGTRVGGPLWDLHEILRDLDPRWVGVQYDIRHAVVEGAQSWPVTLKLLAPWIRCTDLKDFKWEQSPGKGTIENVPLNEGIVPFDAYFKLVSELKISGPMSVHLEYPPFERSTMPEAEKRVKFPALMRKDLMALKAHLAKHKLV
jgi:sugar phosphate isomerase/epimerase